MAEGDLSGPADRRLEGLPFVTVRAAVWSAPPDTALGPHGNGSSASIICRIALIYFWKSRSSVVKLYLGFLPKRTLLCGDLLLAARNVGKSAFIKTDILRGPSIPVCATLRFTTFVFRRVPGSAALRGPGAVKYND